MEDLIMVVLVIGIGLKVVVFCLKYWVVKPIVENVKLKMQKDKVVVVPEEEVIDNNATAVVGSLID
jgi:hypothetical protein